MILTEGAIVTVKEGTGTILRREKAEGRHGTEITGRYVIKMDTVNARGKEMLFNVGDELCYWQGEMK